MLAAISAGENRILLTRDRGLLKRSLVTHGYCVRSTDPRQQIKEVWRASTWRAPQRLSRAACTAAACSKSE